MHHRITLSHSARSHGRLCLSGARHVRGNGTKKSPIPNQSRTDMVITARKMHCETPSPFTSPLYTRTTGAEPSLPRTLSRPLGR